MGRTTCGAARHRKKGGGRGRATGDRGTRTENWRVAKDAVVRAGVQAFRGGLGAKRDFRALWVTRLTAACRMRGISYSRFIFGLSGADIEVNRKMLSEMAISSPADFDALVELAKKHQPKNAAA